ncbi:MAG TPA: AI-2E family transporter [Chloroflexota bacterium]|nr:AI-2E family transporter [Chloroflexota bacterium]
MEKIWLAIQPLAVAILIGAGVVLFLWFISQTVWIWVDVVMALILSSAMSPIVALAERSSLPPGGWHVPRSVALIIVYVLAALIIGVGGFLITSLLIEQVSSIGSNLPYWGAPPSIFVTRLALDLHLPPALVPTAAQLSAELRNAGSVLIAYTTSAIPTFITFVTDVIIVLTIAAFLVIDSERALNFLVSLFPSGQQERARQVTIRMGSALGNWILGLSASMAIIGVLSASTAAILGLPAPVLFGLLSALLELTPMLGQVLMVIPAVLVGLLQSPLVAAEAAVAYVVIAVLEMSVIGPLVAGRSVRLSPIVVAIAIPVGATLYGGLGAILSIPVSGAVQIFLTQVVLPWLHRQEGSPEAPSEPPEAEHSNRAA